MHFLPLQRAASSERSTDAVEPACSQGSKDKQEDPLRKVADMLRSRKGIESRSAVMGDHRVDFFRSKARRPEVPTLGIEK